jgi:Uma2 family endonuclease
MIAEMLDGAVFLTPSPGFGHQDAVLNLAALLRQACPPGLRVVLAPFAVRLGEQTELRPDVLVARYVDLTRDELTAPPLLAVEVRSPSSGLIDRSLKKSVYARYRVSCYWLMDPDTPSLTVYELGEEGEYIGVAHAVGSQPYTAVRPFPVTVVPVELVAGLRPG